MLISLVAPSCGVQPLPNGTDPGPSHSNDSLIFRHVCMKHVQPGEAPEGRCQPWNAEAHPGTFRCGCCGAALFNASAAYDAGTGWPAFHHALPGAVCSIGAGSTEVV